MAQRNGGEPEGRGRSPVSLWASEGTQWLAIAGWYLGLCALSELKSDSGCPVG